MRFSVRFVISWRCLAVFGLAVLGLVAFATQAQMTGELGIHQDSFVHQAQDEADAKNYTSLQTAIIVGNPSEKSGLHADILGQFSPSKSIFNYFTVSELYDTMAQNNNNSTFTVGRIRHNWSLLDQNWNLGVVQPLFRWDPLNPVQQGLTGFLVRVNQDFASEKFQIYLFASPIFIPDQGASYVVENGQFKATSPWFQQPPDKVILFNRPVATQYDLEKPEAWNVIFNSTYAAQLAYGDINQGFYAATSYTRKPMNQFAVSYDGLFNIGTDQVQINAQPYILEHTVKSADLRYSDKLYDLTLSGLHEDIENQKRNDDQTYLYYDPATLISPELGVKFWKTRVAVAYLSRSGGDAVEVGKLARPDRKVLTTRYAFEHATQLKVEMNKNNARNSMITGELSLVQDAETDAGILSLEMNVRLQREFSLALGADFVAEPTDEVKAFDFNSHYQKNDRVYMGVNYVF